MSSVLLLALASAIWGSGFVAQLTGGDAAGPISFSCIRTGLSAFLLSFVIRYSSRSGASEVSNSCDRSALIRGSLVCGTFVFIVGVCQQLGLYMGTSAGKAGFITSIYIVLVPLFGLFWGRRVGARLWIAIAASLVGLWLLCMQGSDALSVQVSDLIVLGAAFGCVFHIYGVDKYSPHVDPLRLAQMQFAVCSVLSLAAALIFEVPQAGGLGPWVAKLTSREALIGVLYAASMPGAFAYSIQFMRQPDVDPTIASLIYSLEAPFAVLTGWIVLGERLSAREMAGCAVLFAAILFAVTVKEER